VFLGAIDGYEVRSPGLGADYAAEIHAAIQRAATMPLAGRRYSHRVQFLSHPDNKLGVFPVLPDLP
jgi:hypothetical protein